MDQSITFLDVIIQSLQQAGTYNKNDQSPPATILWTDKERQWEALIPVLRERLPLLVFGSYHPAQRMGPAYWLRCMISQTIPEITLPGGVASIIYLPGISRKEIRAVEDCPKSLQPLAELQYRGTLWTQKNGRDWTLLAFLQSKEGGIGVEVANDTATKEAVKRALLKLADQTISTLRQSAPLKASFFDALLNPDEISSLLFWLNQPNEYPKSISVEKWQSFCQLCQENYNFNPEKDGPISAAELLGKREGNWELVWQRYLYSPWSFPKIPELLRKARPATQLSLFEASGSWPQDNEAAERQLRDSLGEVKSMSVSEAYSKIEKLEELHAPRREWVWAQIDQAPLAKSLQHLATLAQACKNLLTGVSIEQITAAYTSGGWRVDAAVLDALACVELPEDMQAVKSVIIVFYNPWLERAASVFQQAVAAISIPISQIFGNIGSIDLSSSGTCILFSDALRFDAGMRLASVLEGQGLQCNISHHLSALPSLTPTAKPAISPLTTLLTGKTALALTPYMIKDGTQLTAEKFRQALTDAGYQLLAEDELGDPCGKAWTEMGAIDTFGHQHGCKIAHHLVSELRALQKRISTLLEHGWMQILVITDHGWLMLPDGLPKDNLPEHLTVIRKGRCARLKPFSETDRQSVPWFWDPEVRIAVAPGICCFEAGKEYEHGGLSPQECVTPVLTVSQFSESARSLVMIEKVTWKGLICGIQLSGSAPNLVIDIRSKAGDPSSSLTTIPKNPDQAGNTSLIIENEDRQGEAAFIVVLDESGQLRAQRLITIGG